MNLLFSVMRFETRPSSLRKFGMASMCLDHNDRLYLSISNNNLIVNRFFVCL